jgi:hypothetical protein
MVSAATGYVVLTSTVGRPMDSERAKKLLTDQFAELDERERWARRRDDAQLPNQGALSQHPADYGSDLIDEPNLYSVTRGDGMGLRDVLILVRYAPVMRPIVRLVTQGNMSREDPSLRGCPDLWKRLPSRHDRGWYRHTKPTTVSGYDFGSTSYRAIPGHHRGVRRAHSADSLR